MTARQDTDALLAQAEGILREHGALFAYVHGSRAHGAERPDSDIDIAAYFASSSMHPWDVLLPGPIDLLVLDSAPLELAGRVSIEGELLFEADREARIHWEATTRRIYFDERPRLQRAHREFLETLRHA